MKMLIKRVGKSVVLTKNKNALLKFIWVGFSVLVLIVSLYYFEIKRSQDAEILLIYSMLVLTFPLGLLVSLVLTGFLLVTDMTQGISVFFLLLNGCFFYFWLGAVVCFDSTNNQFCECQKKLSRNHKGDRHLLMIG